MLLNQIDIGHQGRPGIAAFQQVVTENEIFRKTPIDGLPKGVHIVDALADERPLAENILVDVRHLAGVGIDARLAHEQLGESGLAGTGQADRSARLQNRIAFDNAPFTGIVNRSIEGMGQVADQGAGRIAGQLGIGIEGDDVPDRPEKGRIADDLRESVLRPTPEPGIELLQLAALALIAHPHPLHRIPQPGPVKQIEDARAILPVGFIEGLDCGPRIREQGLVLRQRLLGGIAKIGQQGKKQVGIAVAEIADFQGFEQIVDILRTGQQGGHNHHGAMALGDPLGKIETWQCPRWQGEGDQQIDQRNGQGRGRDGQGRSQPPDLPVARIGPGGGEHARCRQQREHQNGTEIQGQAQLPTRPADPALQRQAALDRALQRLAPAIDQVVADMRTAVGVARLLRSRLRKPYGGPCHLQLSAGTAPRHIFDDMPIAVAGGEILVGVLPCRIVAQRLFDDTERLDELPPIHGIDETQTADAVGDRDLVGGGGAAGGGRELGCRHPLFEQFLFDPGLNEDHRRPLGLQPGVKFLHKRRRQRYIGIGKLGQQLNQLFRVPFRRREHAIGPGDGDVEILAPPGNPQPDAAQIFQQRQLQHDRKSPQFPQPQRFHPLIGNDELGGIVFVDAAIHVRNQLQRDVIDAGEAGEGTLRQARQLPAVAAGQMPPRLGNLLLDQIKVVEQPGFCRHDPMPRGGGSDHVIGRQQHPGIVGQLWQQAVRSRLRIDAMLTSQRHAMTLQLLKAEQLRTQQLRLPVVAQRIVGAGRKSEEFSGDDFSLIPETYCLLLRFLGSMVMDIIHSQSCRSP